MYLVKFGYICIREEGRKRPFELMSLCRVLLAYHSNAQYSGNDCTCLLQQFLASSKCSDWDYIADNSELAKREPSISQSRRPNSRFELLTLALTFVLLRSIHSLLDHRHDISSQQPRPVFSSGTGSWILLQHTHINTHAVAIITATALRLRRLPLAPKHRRQTARAVEMANTTLRTEAGSEGIHQ